MADNPQPPSTGDPAIELERHLAELQRHQKAMRSTVVLATLVIVLLTLGFGYATYQRLAQAINRDTLADALQQRAQVLVPQVGQKVSEAAAIAAPVYRDVAFQRLQEVGPQLQDQVAKELESLSQGFEAELKQRIEASLARILGRVGERVEQDFPALAGENQQRLLDSLHDELSSQSQRIQGDLLAMMINEADRIQQVLVKMDEPQLNGLDKEALERRLLHNLIMLADYYVTGTVDEDGLDGSVRPVAAVVPGKVE